MNKWISVEDEKPDVDINGIDEYEDVLLAFKRVCNKCGLADPSYYHGIGFYADNKWDLTEMLDDNYYPRDTKNRIEVTHWMKLPDLPDIK